MRGGIRGGSSFSIVDQVRPVSSTTGCEQRVAGVASDEDFAIYCPACNERFLRPTDAGCCPRCAAEIDESADSILDDTILFRDAPGDGNETARGGKTEAQRDNLVGDRLHVYRCEALLGSGAMGRVYLAHHGDLDRRCALKVLSPRVCQADVDYVKRFLHEGRTAAALIHPNIVTTHAIGESRGYRFLEMEFVPGQSLQDLVQIKNRLSPERALMLGVRIAEGLSAAHQRGIVHRDLKPDNVLVSVQGVPKIADFGLAKRVWRSDDDGEHLVGTPHYMAPELFTGEAATPVSDVYALGVCLYVMLTGRVPYPCGSLRRLMDRVANDPVPIARDACPDVPLETAECVAHLMAKTPVNRPQNAVEALQLLNAIAGDSPDLESLLTSAFRATPNISWTQTGEKAHVEVRLTEGRRQTVYVEPSAHAVAERLLLIYSRCGNARPEYFETGLRLNARMAHGGLAIREIDGTAQFVMFDTYPRGTVDAEEIRRSVLEIAIQADGVERLFDAEDRY